MGSNKTITKKKTAPKAKVKVSTAKKGPKAVAVSHGARHPKGRVTDKHGGKEALAKALAPSLATEAETSDAIADRLKTASNMQLLRLQKVVSFVKDKWGSREKLIAAILDGGKQQKDKDYNTKLSSFSLPRLVDLATSSTRRAG